jgi:hypothetical protein
MTGPGKHKQHATERKPAYSTGDPKFAGIVRYAHDGSV